MDWKKRDLLRLIFALAAIGAGLCYVAFQVRFAPIVAKMAAIQVDNDAAGVINDAIDAAVDAGEFQYDRLVTLEKDANGSITAMQTNMAEVNRLKVSILRTISEKLLDISVEKLSIPLGSVVLPEVFSGHGPRIPVRILAIRASNASFENRFSEAGINQTQQQIIINVTIAITVVTPAGEQEVVTKTNAVVAETVIVGDVPDTLVTFGN